MKPFKALFVEEDHSATALHMACLKVYGSEYLDWEIDTLELNIEDDLGIQIKSEVFDRLHALGVALSTELYYKYFESFEKINKALNFCEPYFTIVTPCSPEEIFTGIWEVKLNDSDITQFSEEVNAYIRASLKMHGFYQAPKELKFCDYDKFYDSTWVIETFGDEAHQQKTKQFYEFFKIKKELIEEEMKRFPF